MTHFKIRVGVFLWRLFGLVVISAVFASVASAAMPSGGSGSLAASLSAMTFGNQTVGTVSGSQTVTLTNTGKVAVSIIEVGVFGVFPQDYATTSTCGSTIAAGKNCTVGVTFKPSGTGPRYAAVFVSNTTVASPQIVALSGTGLSGKTSPPTVSLPSSVGFGSVPVSPAESTTTVTLTNSGKTALSFNRDPQITGANERDFTITSSTCSQTEQLDGGESCRVTLAFTPSPLAESESATLTFSDSAGTQNVSITGSGKHWIGIEATPSPTHGVSSYNVYRGTSSGVYGASPVKTCTNITTPTSCIDADASLVPGKLYYYVITAVLGGRESPHSNQISVVFP